MPFTVYMPKLSPTMTEGVIAKWHKQVGDFVESGDVLLEISTDKATVEHAALDEGYLRAIIGQEGEKIDVNAPLAVFTASKEESIDGYKATALGEAPKAEMTSSAPATKAAAPVAVKRDAKVAASPLAKKLAKERGIDLTNVAGSGPSGRIMSRDLAQGAAQMAAPAVALCQAEQTIVEEALSPMRKVIAQRLQESKSTIPHFYVRQEVDAAPIVALREELKKLELSYTVNDFIIKACAIALKKHPEINSGFDSKSQKALRFSRVDICVAVTIQGGLITPIVADAAKKSLSTISQEVKQLASRAREGKLQPQEYQGGSFTISNLGMYGVNDMTAIINPPQGAILGVGAAQDVPVVKNGQIVPGKRMSLTISCDHRVIDGAEAAQFMRTLKQLIENPILFLSE